MVNTLDKLELNKKAFRIQHFKADFLLPQNPEFRNDPENFHSCVPRVFPGAQNPRFGTFSIKMTYKR